MNQNIRITYKALQIDDMLPNLLKDFNRYQETNKVWYKAGVQYLTKQDSFRDEWNLEKKREVVQNLKQCIQRGGYVVGAFHNQKIIGFANVDVERFGSNAQYVELPYIHVSNEFRGCGIGKVLFKKSCEAAKRSGATKLYIAAHPAVETQWFYNSVGCTYAEEVNEAILRKEPLDLQLECRL
ncbi:GNAT family N-acetyltransferase [Pontibacillus sp. HMF3514]|uniref:GNAT family N-acetyltransferase n=1 Tax=Pontibacillus sp. HMF3514 TaxID=2692425 RepID=UPI00131F4DEE|nr:GNAT family N-acetyltransferase [Pontibacillus sp. HMF3514]QHE54092.1 GNAT family N-acetyltransferase [Pontibacillus sp. HMF3514]